MKPIKDYRGGERLIERIILEIPENSQVMQRFKMVHPHLCQWYHTALGKKYLEQHGGEL